MVTAVFAGNPYYSLLAGIGSFIPDLDRDYLFFSRKTFRDEELHRALFHNLLFLSALLFINQWLAFGAFLHCFIDSFTTEKDRGVEWLFPFSRLVKRGRYALLAKSRGSGCKLELADQNPSDRVCFLNEDSPELSKLSVPELRESKPVPWRRTYGPAVNNQLLDKWIGLGSYSLLVVYSLVNWNFSLAGISLILSINIIAPACLLIGIVLVYVGGWLKKKNKPQSRYLLLYASAVTLLLLSVVLAISQGVNYSSPINPLFAIFAVATLTLEGVLVWRISIRRGKQAIV